MGSHLIEALGLASPIVEVRYGYLQLRQSGMRLPNLNQLIWIAKRQRLNQDRIDDAKESRICAYGQRDRQNRGNREDRPPAKRAHHKPHGFSIRPPASAAVAWRREIHRRPA